MDAALLAVELTPHTERFAGRSGIREVAARLGKSRVACVSRLYRLMRARGHRPGDQWTTDGLWSPEEDQIILDCMEPSGPVPPGTWPRVAADLGRTTGAVRVRAFNLRRRGASLRETAS